jgi:hypothetical protein
VIGLDLRRWDTAALGSAWRAARPFPHLVVDRCVGEAGCAALREAVLAEPHGAMWNEVCDALASAPEPLHPSLRAFAAALGDEATLAAVRAITGKAVRAVEVRSYVYRAGHYLLPHTDGAMHAGRLVAFAYYLTPPGGCAGGELEIYDCTVDGGDIVDTRAAGTIPHRADRRSVGPSQRRQCMIRPKNVSGAIDEIDVLELGQGFGAASGPPAAGPALSGWPRFDSLTKSREQ